MIISRDEIGGWFGFIVKNYFNNVLSYTRLFHGLEYLKTKTRNHQGGYYDRYSGACSYLYPSKLRGYNFPDTGSFYRS